MLVDLLVPGFVFYQLLLQYWNDLGPSGHGAAAHFAAAGLELLVGPLVLGRFHQFADRHCYDVFEVHLDVAKKLLYSLAVNLAILVAALVIEEHDLAVLLIDLGGTLVLPVLVSVT